MLEKIPYSLTARRLLVAKDTKAQGTHGGANADNTTYTRTFSEVYNTIPNASVNAGTLTLPPGVYMVLIIVPALSVKNHKAYLHHAEQDSILLTGTSENVTIGASAEPMSSNCIIQGIIEVLFVSNTLTVKHFTEEQNTVTDGGASALGRAINLASIEEVYTQVIVEKIG
jgi:hypothetical protein